MSTQDERERLLRELTESLNAVEAGLNERHGQRLLAVTTNIMTGIVAKHGPSAVYSDATRYAKQAAGIAEAVLVEVGAAVAKQPRFSLPPEAPQ